MSRRKRKPLIVIKTPHQQSAVEIRLALNENKEFQEMKKDFHFIVVVGSSDQVEFEEFGTIYANNTNLKKVEEILLERYKENLIEEESDDPNMPWNFRK